MGLSMAALLCFELCAVRAYEFFDIPGPWLEVWPTNPVPLGASLVLHCKGAHERGLYRLYREAVEEPVAFEDSRRESWSSVFMYSNMSQAHAGRFRCHYNFHSFWSKLSEPLDVRVSDVYERPFLWVTPGLNVPLGRNFTFHCRSEVGLDMFVLYRGTPEKGFQTFLPEKIRKNQATFPFLNKTEAMDGSYRCFGFMSSEPFFWSNSSDVLVLLSGGAPSTDRGTILPTRVVLVLQVLGVLLAWSRHKPHERMQD